MIARSLSRSGPTALQQHGQELYRQGDFKTAVEAFTQALRKKDADYIGVLDNRAATYTKLAQYDLALSDSRQIIRRDKHDERGYLRCAKVLILDGNPEKALDVYAYGLRTLPDEHPQRQLVKQMHDKLRVKLFAKRQDPFGALPLEIVGMVLQYFEFREIVAVLRVSKKWEQLLTSMRQLWMRIDFKSTKRKVHWHSVRACIRRSKAMLTYAVISDLAVSSTIKSLQLLSKCPNLEHLEFFDECDGKDLYDLFKSSKRLKAIVAPNVPIRELYISNFLTDLPLLERVEFFHVTGSHELSIPWTFKHRNLKRLGLHSRDHLGGRPSRTFAQIYSSSFPIVLEALPILVAESRLANDRQLEEFDSISNLEELHLYDLTAPISCQLVPAAFQNLRVLDIGRVWYYINQVLPPSLEYLRLRTCIIALGGVGSVWPFELPNLRTLVFDDVRGLTIEIISLLIGATKAPLQELSICDIPMSLATFDPFASLKRKGNLNELTKLVLSRITGVHDTVVAFLVDGMQELKVLDFSYTDITGCTIKMLADFRSEDQPGKPKIDRLVVRGCCDVSSDAVAYGRAKGIEIIS